MEIMLHVNKLDTGSNGRVIQVSAVGFDFGKLMDPNEFLQRDLLMFDMVVDTGFPAAAEYVARTVADIGHLELWLDACATGPCRRRAAAEAIAMCRRRGLPDEVFVAFNNWVKRNIGKRAFVWTSSRNEILAIRHGLFGVTPSWEPHQERQMYQLLTPEDTVSSYPLPLLDGMIPFYGLHEAAVKAAFLQRVWARSRTAGKAGGGKLSAVPKAADHVNQEEQPRHLH
jgi:hypothetical protein